jgi:N-methylhydantoinase A
VARVAEAIGQEVEDAAMAVVRIANNNMNGALRSVLIERGLDPRDFALCAFGGAGPLHASELIADLGIPRAIIPNHPGQFSAYGFIMTNARVDRQRTTQLTSRRFDPARAAEVMETLVREGVAELAEQGYTEGIEAYRALEMRYLGQNYELELPVGPEALAAGKEERLWRAFHEAHAARFGFSTPGEIIEIVNYTATVVSRTAKPEPLRLPAGTGEPEPVAHRAIRYPGGTHEVPVYRREALRAGDRIKGPAVVEEAASVTVVNPGQLLTVDPFGHLLIDAAAG